MSWEGYNSDDSHLKYAMKLAKLIADDWEANHWDGKGGEEIEI